MRYRRYTSPVPGGVLYSVRSGVCEYRRREDFEPPWLRFLNLTNRLVGIASHKRKVRRYARDVLRIECRLNSTLWFDLNESNRFLDYCLNPRKFVRELRAKEEKQSPPNPGPSPGIPRDARGRPDFRIRPMEEFFLPSGSANSRIFEGKYPSIHAVRKLHELFLTIPRDRRWNMSIPSWYTDMIGIRSSLLRKKSRMLTIRERAITLIARMHYIVYYDVGPHMWGKRTRFSLSKQSFADCSSHLLKQASTARYWQRAVERLYGRLKFLLAPFEQTTLVVKV